MTVKQKLSWSELGKGFKYDPINDIIAFWWAMQNLHLPFNTQSELGELKVLSRKTIYEQQYAFWLQSQINPIQQEGGWGGKPYSIL